MKTDFENIFKLFKIIRSYCNWISQYSE